MSTEPQPLSAAHTIGCCAAAAATDARSTFCVLSSSSSIATAPAPAPAAEAEAEAEEGEVLASLRAEMRVGVRGDLGDLW